MVGLDDIEEFGHHERNTAEMSWTEFTFHHFIQVAEIELQSDASSGTFLHYRGRKAASQSTFLSDSVSLSRVRGYFEQIIWIVELCRVDEDGANGNVVFRFSPG